MRSSTLALLLALLVGIPHLPFAGATHESYYPTCTSSVGRDVMLVIDRSSSMLDESKIVAAKTAATALLSTLSPTQDQSGLVSFASWFSLDKGLSFSHAQTQTAVNALVASGATNLGAAVKLARHELDNGLPSPAFGAPYSGNARANAEHIMIVLSDGEPTYFTADALSEANHAKHVSEITVFTIGLGSGAPPALLSQMASSPSHFYMSPDPNQLLGIFQQISAKLNDTQIPTTTIVTPHATNHQLFHNYAAVGPSELAGVSTATSGVTASATASDDCLVDRVVYSLQVGSTTIPLGQDHISPFTASFDCAAQPPGRVTIVAQVYDWLNKTSTATRDVVCVRAHVDSQATAFYARVTNPADPRVRTEGARLPATLPGADTHDVLTEAEASPFPYDISILHDEVNGSLPLAGGAHRYAQALSRSINATFVTLGLDLKALETTARAQADADPLANPMGAPTRLAVGASGGVLSSQTGDPQVDPLVSALTAFCTTDIVSQEFSITRCGSRIEVDVGVTLILGETITVTGPWWKEITVNGAHVLVDRPDLRAEIILSQSYAGASWIGASGLLGPQRTLDLENDAGSGADAPPGLLAANALPLTPGVYGARIATPQDVDAYAFTLAPGKKIHAFVGVSDVVSAEVGSLSSLPAADPSAVAAYATSLPSRATTATALPALTVRLLDPSGVVRDTKAIPAGAGQAVELNVDRPGDWTVIVSASTTSASGDYTLIATIADAPMIASNDAMLGADAGGSCASAMLVGPGAHVGALEDGDLSDWYRFHLEEGQILALVLRPGDTVEAADMRLTFYDRACNVAGYGLVATGLVKGSPETVTFTVPTSGSGIYRAHVQHVNGIGTYELSIATSVVATP